MTFNALMLPAVPPTSAAGLKAAGDSGPTALKSGHRGESAKGDRSFLDTLNHVSLRKYDSHHKSTGAKIRSEVSPGSVEEPPNRGKASNASNDSPNQTEEAGAAASAERSPIVDPWRAFGMIHLRFFDFSMAGNDSSANETQSATTDGSNSVFPQKLMGHFQAEGQDSLVDWLVGIGPFEQLQTNISPEAGNRYLAEQLAAESAINPDSRGMLGTQAEFIGFWQWQVSSPEVALSNPAASLWDNGDTLLAALWQMQQTAAASGLNADTGGQNASAYLETIPLSEDFLAKMTNPSLPGATDLSETTKLAENANMTGAGKDALMTLWSTADPNSETFLETPSRQATENAQLYKMNADIKAGAEQPANPNFVTEGVPSKPADDGFSLTNPVLKSESLPIAELGTKATPVEGDNRDGGFLFGQDQMPEHLKTLEGATRSFEGAQRGLNSQALDQIVQKAVLLLNNGQHEVHIELKPEFLGHIRMQIVTESQQVAIKITAELPFVKDMLESNLNQLKAELQAQGLKIDSLEVSVGHDSYAEGDTHQAAKVPKVEAVRNGTDLDDGSAEKASQAQSHGDGAMAETAIDYFA
jgi:flagellar hook-length control protein FliK